MFLSSLKLVVSIGVLLFQIGIAAEHDPTGKSDEKSRTETNASNNPAPAGFQRGMDSSRHRFFTNLIAALSESKTGELDKALVSKLEKSYEFFNNPWFCPEPVQDKLAGSVSGGYAPAVNHFADLESVLKVANPEYSLALIRQQSLSAAAELKHLESYWYPKAKQDGLNSLYRTTGSIAGDYARIILKYPHSKTATDTALKLLMITLDKGDFLSASLIGDYLIRTETASKLSTGHLMALGMAYARMGRVPELEKIETELNSDSRAKDIDWGGKTLTPKQWREVFTQLTRNESLETPEKKAERTLKNWQQLFQANSLLREALTLSGNPKALWNMLDLKDDGFVPPVCDLFQLQSMIHSDPKTWPNPKHMAEAMQWFRTGYIKQYQAHKILDRNRTPKVIRSTTKTLDRIDLDIYRFLWNDFNSDSALEIRIEPNDLRETQQDREIRVGIHAFLKGYFSNNPLEINSLIERGANIEFESLSGVYRGLGARFDRWEALTPTLKTHHQKQNLPLSLVLHHSPEIEILPQLIQAMAAEETTPLRESKRGKGNNSIHESIRILGSFRDTKEGQTFLLQAFEKSLIPTNMLARYKDTLFNALVLNLDNPELAQKIFELLKTQPSSMGYSYSRAIVKSRLPEEKRIELLLKLGNLNISTLTYVTLPALLALGASDAQLKEAIADLQKKHTAPITEHDWVQGLKILQNLPAEQESLWRDFVAKRPKPIEQDSLDVLSKALSRRPVDNSVTQELLKVGNPIFGINDLLVFSNSELPKETKLATWKALKESDSTYYRLAAKLMLGEHPWVLDKPEETLKKAKESVGDELVELRNLVILDLVQLEPKLLPLLDEVLSDREANLAISGDYLIGKLARDNPELLGKLPKSLAPDQISNRNKAIDGTSTRRSEKSPQFCPDILPMRDFVPEGELELIKLLMQGQSADKFLDLAYTTALLPLSPKSYFTTMSDILNDPFAIADANLFSVFENRVRNSLSRINEQDKVTLRKLLVDLLPKTQLKRVAEQIEALLVDFE